MIERVTNYDGRVIDDFPPEVTDVLPAPIARLEVSMLREVINSGTATRAQALKRPLAGKTGTTNDFADGWFIGFSPSLACGVWVGFDNHRELGPKEEGARVALPIWMEFMGEALKDQPVEDFPHSPLLKDPEQVKEILASTGTERLLAEGSPGAPAGAATPGAPPAPGSSLPTTPPAVPAKPAPAPAPKATTGTESPPRPATSSVPAQPQAAPPSGKNPAAPGKPAGAPANANPAAPPG